MKRIFLTFCFGLFVSLAACGQTDPNANIDEGKIEGNLYTSKEVGWTLEIPTGWSIVEKEKREATDQKGLKALEEVAGKIDYSGLRHLISFQKNRFNIFQSTSEPFKVEYEGEWEKNHAALKEVIYLAYANQGIKADSSATTIEKIDGLDFQAYTFTIYSKNGNAILKQIMYGRLINGLDFGVNINYNNEQDKEEMLAVWKKSKFKKR